MSAPTANQSAQPTEPVTQSDGRAQSAAQSPEVAFPAFFAKGELLGSGGMGDVFAAEDLRLGRTVAVKLLQDKFPTSGPHAQRFVREYRISACLEHPGIPPVYEAGFLPNGRPYMAMRLVRGGTLAAQLENITADELRARRDDFIAIFETIVRTLAYAHSQGVIHRDLKPSNVMVGAHGEVQVMDWGLGKELSNPFGEEYTLGPAVVSVSGEIQGTPECMAPEQALGESDAIGPHSDVFGLGAILCYLLTGKPPFVGSNIYATLAQAASGKVDGAHERLANCGADVQLVGIAQKCLRKEPADRYTDANELERALSAWRAQKANEARECLISSTATAMRLMQDAELQRERAEREAAIRKARELEKKHMRYLYDRAATGEGWILVARLETNGANDATELRALRSGLQLFVPPSALRGTNATLVAVWERLYVGDLAAAVGDLPGAAAEYQAAVAPAEAEFQSAQAIHASALYESTDFGPRTASDEFCAATRALSACCLKLGDLAFHAGEGDNGASYYAKAKRITEDVYGLNPQHAECRRDLTIFCSIHAQLAEARGDVAGAIDNYRKAKRLTEKATGLATEAEYIRERLEALIRQAETQSRTPSANPHVSL
jgi:serine/threonine protein kinase